MSARSASADPPVVILMTSNGAGMGHLARQAAVAAAAGSGFSPLLLSLSTALPTVAASSGMPAEYCPGPTRQWMPTDVWHRYLERRLVALVREVGATALVFDGTSPYPGLLAARRSLPDLLLVWSRPAARSCLRRRAAHVRLPRSPRDRPRPRQAPSPAPRRTSPV